MNCNLLPICLLSVFAYISLVSLLISNYYIITNGGQQIVFPFKVTDQIYQPGNKVIVILVGGLNYKWAIQSSPLKTAFSKHSKDSKLLKLKALIPTFSIPNLVSLLTGTPPELHARFGNTNLNTINLDSIYQRISDSGKFGAVVGSEALKSLVPVSNNFDYFIINNQIKPDEILKGFDDTVAKTTTDVINSLKYDFILSYFANTDVTANEFGANSDSEMYINALQEMSDHVEKIISLVDEETVVILTSDHGIGGDDGENESITDIPLWVYKKQSDFERMKFVATPQFYSDNDTPTLLDIPVLISSLMGIPPPQQSMGKIPLDLLILLSDPPSRYPTNLTANAYYNIAKQRRELVGEMMNIWNRGESFPDIPIRIQSNNADTIDSQLRIYTNLINALNARYHTIAVEEYTGIAFKNMIIGIVASLLGTILSFALLYKTKFVSMVQVQKTCRLVSAGFLAFASILGTTFGIFRLFYTWDYMMANNIQDFIMLVLLLLLAPTLISIIVIQIWYIIIKKMKGLYNSEMTIFCFSMIIFNASSAIFICTSFGLPIFKARILTESAYIALFRINCVAMIILGSLVVSSLYAAVFSYRSITMDERLVNDNMQKNQLELAKNADDKDTLQNSTVTIDEDGPISNVVTKSRTPNSRKSRPKSMVYSGTSSRSTESSRRPFSAHTGITYISASQLDVLRKIETPRINHLGEIEGLDEYQKALSEAVKSLKSATK